MKKLDDIERLKKSTTQFKIIPLGDGIRAVLIDNAGRTYGIVRANTLSVLVAKKFSLTTKRVSGKQEKSGAE